MTKVANVDPATLSFYEDPGARIGENFPSGENQEGKTFSWNPNSQLYELRHTKVCFGPMAITAGPNGNGGNYPLGQYIPGQPIPWTRLISPLDFQAFHGDMVGYLPKGRWGAKAQVAVAAPVDDVTFYMRIMQGTVEADVNRPNMAFGSPVLVGEGVGTSGKANRAFMIHGIATDIQFGGGPGKACEVVVEMCATAPGCVALATTGPIVMASRGEFIRWDGLYGVS